MEINWGSKAKAVRDLGWEPGDEFVMKCDYMEFKKGEKVFLDDPSKDTTCPKITSFDGEKSRFTFTSRVEPVMARYFEAPPRTHIDEELRNLQEERARREKEMDLIDRQIYALLTYNKAKTEYEDRENSEDED